MSPTDNEDAAFVARVTASTTHEIRNVLAIVKESAGLIADMVQVCDESGALTKERFERVVSRIDAQVNRGAELITSLNHFAHTLDKSDGAVDLNSEVEQIAFLSQRTARQRNHTVEVAPPVECSVVAVNPFRLHMVLFAAVECCMDQMAEAGTVVLRSVREREHPAVEIVGRIGDAATPSTPDGSAGWPRLQGLVDDLAGSLTVKDGTCQFLIILPVAAS